MEPFSRRISWGMLHFLSHCTCVSSFFFNLLASFGVFVFLSFNQGGQWGSPRGPGGPSRGAREAKGQTQGGHGPLAPRWLRAWTESPRPPTYNVQIFSEIQLCSHFNYLISISTMICIHECEQFDPCCNRFHIFASNTHYNLNGFKFNFSLRPLIPHLRVCYRAPPSVRASSSILGHFVCESVVFFFPKFIEKVY